jgi:hypothetical protein
VQDLLLRHIPCEIWVNGSFVTAKIEPRDLDVIIKLDYDVTVNLTPAQQEFIDRLEQGTYNDRIDSFTFTCLPRGHSEFEAGEFNRSEWARLCNVEHGDFWLKGVAVVRLGETDVGLHFYP